MNTLSAKEKVYSIEMLREMIIEYFIFDEENQPSKKDLRVARLVDKTWLACTSKLLAKSVSSPPLFEFEIYFDPTTQILCQKHKNGTVSNKNIDRLISPNLLHISVLPFRLKITKDCFRQQNYSYFYKLLCAWGNSLKELHITFPSCGGTMTFSSPSPMLNFPVLNRLTVDWARGKLTVFKNGEKTNVFGNNANSLFLIQYFLNAAPNLDELVLHAEIGSRGEVGFPSKGVEYLHLPSTLTSLNLSCFITEKQLETLTRKPLQSFKRLVMQSDGLFWEKDLMYKVLQKNQSSLKYLKFESLVEGGMVKSVFSFTRIPLLPKLKTLIINSDCIELETGQVNLERRLPALTNLVLLHQTKDMLTKWVDNSKFKGVSQLELSVVNEENNIDAHNGQFNFGDDKDNLSIVDIDKELMSRVLVAFPNITCLKLQIPCNANDSLHLIFCEMGQLKKLAIYCPWSAINKNGDNWTSTFLGIPIELVVGLKTVPYSWSSLDLQALSLNGVNIAKLRALESISLFSYSLTEEIEDKHSWLSDLVLQLAFMKMPNLTFLKLSGKFKPSAYQIGSWEEKIPRKMCYRMQNGHDDLIGGNMN